MLRALNIAILALVLDIGAIAKSAAEMPDVRSASLEFLRQQFGESVRFQAFLDFNKILQGKAWERPSPKLNDLVITGFERIGGFSNDELRQILSSLYADTFLRNSLGGIRYISHSQPGTAASVRDVGYIQMNVFNDPDDGAREMTKERALYLIQHELGHANDWNYSRLFSPAERLEMLAEVTGRFLQPGHFVGYHERQHVVYDRRNPHDNFYQTVREYWADLAREVVRSPDALRAHHPQDYELAQKWIRRLSGEAGPINLARR